MIRSILLVALLSSGCHTTVYRTESEPVRIHVVRPARPAGPRTNGAAAEHPEGGEPGAAAPQDAGANEPPPDPGGRP